MNHDTKISFIVALFILMAMTLSQRSQAAVNLAPTVSGYGAGMLTGSGHTLTAANDGYIKPAITNVGGKAITVPATMRMAANAGNYAKSMMRLNPYLLVGTLALGWLIENQMILEDGVLMYTPSEYTFTSAGAGCNNPLPQSQFEACVRSSAPAYYNFTFTYDYPAASVCVHRDGDAGCWYFGQIFAATGTPRPATEQDMLALPDPLPVIAPELPSAPYMPEGVPVDPPEYDFVPFSVPLGQPYTKPDGSTAQPMAKVSPNEELITVDTYDEPLTDPNGNPLADPAPQDTPEPVPEQKTDCEKFPESLGCAQLGTASDVPIGTESRSIAAIAPVSVGGAGACPSPLTASFMGQTVSFSYDMPCQFATSLKPLILAIAWLSAGLIFIGGVRQ